MEQKFAEKWLDAIGKARALGVRIRPATPETALAAARRCLSSSRESDGFWALADLGQLSLSLEALAVSPAFTGLFTDAQVNTALSRLLDAGYFRV